MVAVIRELLTTVVASAVPLNTITDEETKSLPVSFREKLGGNCENAMVVGDTESRTGVGRALPQSGFRELQPDRSSNRTRSPRRVVVEAQIIFVNASSEWEGSVRHYSILMGAVRKNDLRLVVSAGLERSRNRALKIAR